MNKEFLYIYKFHAEMLLFAVCQIPNFMDDVRLIGFDLGKEVPLICKATLPSLDDQGLWMDLEILYTGRLRVTIETKCNLLKLKGMSTKDVPRVCKRFVLMLLLKFCVLSLKYIYLTLEIDGL